MPGDARMPFRAGQYLNILLTDGERRAFPFANPPQQSDLIELHVRLVIQGSPASVACRAATAAAVWRRSHRLVRASQEGALIPMATLRPPTWTRLVSGVLASACAWILAQNTLVAPAGYDHFAPKHLWWVILSACGTYTLGLYALTGRVTLERPLTRGAHPHASPWTDYRNYERRFLWVFLGGGVFVAVLTWLISLISTSLWVKMAPIMAWAVAWVVLQIPLREFPCPRCKGSFFYHVVFGWYWPFARSCLQCGLRKWEDWPTRGGSRASPPSNTPLL